MPRGQKKKKKKFWVQGLLKNLRVTLKSAKNIFLFNILKVAHDAKFFPLKVHLKVKFEEKLKNMFLTSPRAKQVCSFLGA